MIIKICSCPNCREIAIPGRKFCKKHCIDSDKKHEAFVNAKRTNTELYNTVEWRALRKRIILEQKVCQSCGSETDLTVDHIIEPRGNRELFFSYDNLQVLCKACHRIKTAYEIRERRKTKNE